MNELSLFTPLICSSSHVIGWLPSTQLPRSRKIGQCSHGATLSSPPIQSRAQDASLYYIKGCVHLCLSLTAATFFAGLLSLAPYYTLYKQLLIFLELTSHHITFPLQTGQWIFKSTQGDLPGSTVVKIQSFHFRGTVQSLVGKWNPTCLEVQRKTKFKNKVLRTKSNSLVGSTRALHHLAHTHLPSHVPHNLCKQ